MDTFVEAMKIVFLLIGVVVLMIFVIPFIIDKLMTATGVTEKEKQDMADHMDEFLYGDVPNNEEIKKIQIRLDKIKQLIETKNDSTCK